MTRPTLLVSALTDHRATSREQALLEALQGSVLSAAVATWDVRLHIADSDPRLPEQLLEGTDAVILLEDQMLLPSFMAWILVTPEKVSTGQKVTGDKSR